MVGVPRSKGCLTCRRRKVACDQTKPHCQNCQKRGVQCEGYARYPTILQYTGSGLKKRDRFEEAVATDSSTLLFGRRSATQSGITVLPKQPTASRFILDQFGSLCIDSYLPLVGSGGATQELKSNWMWMTLDMSDWGQALGTSIAALCLARVGAVNKDEVVLSRARTQYALGLNALQYALKKPELAFQDRTLAAIRTLSIYELSSLPLGSLSKAHVHEEGMVQWCLAAGPQNINTKFGLQIFHDVRWCIMNRAIEFRKRSPLDTEDWKTLPWKLYPKDSLQRLWDHGFELAALLERLDVCESPQLPEASQSLDEWYVNHWSAYDYPSAASTDANDELSPVPSPGTGRPEFESVWEATSMIYFWLFKMTLNDILAATAVQDDEQDFTFSSLELAVNIVSASSYFLSDATGWLGPQRLFFPLRGAMTLLVSKQSPFADDAQRAFGQLLGKLRASRG